MRNMQNLNLVVFAGSFSMFYYELEKGKTFSDVCKPGFFYDCQARPGDVIFVKDGDKTYQTRLLKGGTIENMAAAAADPASLINDALITAVAQRLAEIAKSKNGKDEENLVFEAIPDTQMLVVKDEAVSTNFKNLSETLNDVLATLRAAGIIDDGQE